MTPVASGRLTNLSLLVLLAVAFASGWLAFELKQSEDQKNKAVQQPTSGVHDLWLRNQ